MKLIGKALALGFAVATASVVACSTGPHQSQQTGQTPLPPSEDGTGNVGLQYTLPGGEHISTVSYTLTNGTNSYSGTVNVAGSSTISFVVGGVAAGTGYNITLTATSDDGSVSCSGSAGPFAVTARATTTVNVNLICTTGNNDAGSVLINAPTSNCPIWNTIVANPSKALLGQTVTLSAAANAPDPGSVSFLWTVTSGTGTITNNTATLNAADSGKNDTATFTCPTGAGETDTITLVVSDGPVPEGGACPTSGTTGTVTVTCGAPPKCTLPGESGVVASPDSAAGTCGTDPANGKPMVNSGTADSNGDFCCIDACNGGPTATPFNGTGTCTGGLVNDGTGCCVSLQPCTKAGQINCVQCQGNSSNTCSGTEALFVAHDIATKKATAAGPDPNGSCYTCLLNGGCLDDTTFGDANHECEDFGAATFNGGSSATECSSTISCILGSSCASSAVSTCYCGTAGLSSTCQGNPAPGPINGACDTQISTGLGFPLTDGTDNTKNLTDVSKPAGRADQIFQCAQSNSCSACLQ